MEVDANEEEGGSVCMKVADESAVVDVSANVGNGGKSGSDVGSVMYCEEEPG